MMKIIQRLIDSINGRFDRTEGRDEQFRCTETSCKSLKTIKGSIDQRIPAHDRCFNISNCSL